MAASDIVIWAALAAAVLMGLLSAIGLALGATVHDRVHYLGPSGLSAALVALAMWVDVGASMLALKAVLLTLILVAGSPILAHAISRAARIRERGDWTWRPSDAELEDE